jgi:hypothetical protein
MSDSTNPVFGQQPNFNAADPAGAPVMPDLGAQWAPPTAPVVAAEVPEPVESVLISTDSTAPNNNRKLLAITAVGAVLLTVVGVVAFRSFGGSSAGAQSPSKAVDQMMTAVQNEDALSILNLMAPSEIGLFGGSRDELNRFWGGNGDFYEQLRDQGFEFDPGDPIPGLTLTLSNLAYETEETGNVAKVTVTSLDGEWSFDPRAFLDKVDFETFTDGQFEDDEVLDELDLDVELQSGEFNLDDLELVDGELFLMTFQEDDSWFVSPMYTILEAARVSADLGEPNFNADTSGTGADTPEEALEGMIEAVGAGDLEDIIGLLPPNGYQALHDYAEPLAELAGEGTGIDVKADVEELTRRDDGTFELTEVTVEVVEDSGVRTVVIEDECITYTREFSDGFVEEPVEVCIDDLGEEFAPFEDGIPGIETLFVEIREQNGRFYVDPLGSIFALIGAADFEELGENIEDFVGF